MNDNQQQSGTTLNRAKPYQLALFPLNNGATNVYYVLILTYIATFGNTVLGIATVFASFMVTGMRIFDAITDPIIGALMDKTNGRFGKFRPFMVIGSVIMAVSVVCLYILTPFVPESMMGLRYALFILLYAVWVIGYTFQTSVTRAAQAVLTNDPKQRPLFTIFNTIGSLAGMGLMQFIGPILARDNIFGDYNRSWFAAITPIGICISVLLTILAIIGIWEKDQPKYFGLGGGKQQKVKVSEYIDIIKANKPLQRLMVAGGACKLALSIATNITVLIMLYSCMMGDYDGLYMPMMVVGYIFAVPFFGLTVRTSQKKGQKASLMRYVAVAFVCYIGVLALLLLWNPNTSMHMQIPMVADCADYETYRSGKFIPGIMGTLFSLVDKLVSSLSATVVGVAVTIIGLDALPTKATPYTDGMNIVVIILFCIVPMCAWALTLWSMTGYELDGERVKEIQEVNGKRREAIAQGMSIEEAMEQYPSR